MMKPRLTPPIGKPLLLGFGCPEGVQVGWGVSEVQAAFVTSPATVYGNHDDRHCNSIGAACDLEVGYRLPNRGEGGIRSLCSY
jgi:hypothetical protein